MALNFSGGPPKKTQTKPVDPIKIFQSRPAIEGQINDLWQGQAEALSQWFTEKKNDVLISLNTGAGKSVVGVLICQSMLNQGIANPVYLCATNDLVDQTAAEARKLALSFSTKVSGDFSNDLYETSQGFLITSYQTLINAKTTLRGDLAPGGIVFDDAHVGEPIIRSQFTLRFNARRHSALFQLVLDAVQGQLAPPDSQRLRFILDSQRSGGGTFLCPPDMGSKIEEVLNSLRQKVESSDKPDIIFPYLYLALRWHACAIAITKDEIEISPPFLPTRTLSCFSNKDVRRVYLSATLKAESEFVRAYGAPPSCRIEPAVDAGNGERTILSARPLKDRDVLTTWAERQARKSKVLVAVPSRYRAEAWQGVAKVPERADFLEKLKAFRRAPKGGFVLAGRFDGIDLPDSTCRLMIIAGLPAGGSLLESYLWQKFEMQNLLAARVATRITQLFGRIIRGRTDFGFFLLQGDDLTKWLSRDRNVALLPELLQQQIKLGDHVQVDFGVKTLGQVEEFMAQVMDRDPDWLKYYRDFIDTNPLSDREVQKRAENEAAQLVAARAEARFAEALWQRRYADATKVLEPAIQEVADADSRLAGWLGLWTGCAYGMAENAKLAQDHYRIARSRIPLEFELPSGGERMSLDQLASPNHASDDALRRLFAALPRGFETETKEREKAVADGLAGNASSNQAEEAYRLAGAFLGFDASRPDNDEGAGPDVLWLDPLQSTAVSFELKTDKGTGTVLNKKEVGQSHNHIQWIKDQHPDYKLERHLLVGTELTCTSSASPGDNWFLTEPPQLIAIVKKFIARIDALRRMKEEPGLRALAKDSDDGVWSLAAVAEHLSVEALHDSSDD